MASPSIQQLAEGQAAAERRTAKAQETAGRTAAEAAKREALQYARPPDSGDRVVKDLVHDESARPIAELQDEAPQNVAEDPKVHPPYTEQVRTPIPMLWGSCHTT